MVGKMSWNPIKAVKKLHKAMPGVGSSDPKKAFINLHNAMPGTKEYIGELDSKGNIVERGAYDPFVDINTNMTYQPPLGYQLAQMPQYQAQQLPQTQGTDYNPMFAQMIRQMQMQPQQPQQRSGGTGNYLFGQSFIPQPQQQYQQQYGQRYQQSQNQQMPQFDYTQAMMGRRFF
jgi:hypothetical protein